jgi:hypothetical protein
LFFPFAAHAVDGIILIDQNRALAGSTTPGDGPGFPVTLSLPGSYRLSGNLTVPDANVNAIEVTADNVSIDLNGFSIIGPAVCNTFTFDALNQIPTEHPASSCTTTGIGVGIKAADPFLNCSCGPVNNFKYSTRISNGTVSGMGSHGIIVGPGSRIEHVTVRSNGGNGIITGRGSVVLDNIALGNLGIGFFTGNGNVVRGNTAALNGNFGFEVFSGTINNNSTLGNGSAFPNNFIQGGESPHVFSENANQ